MSFKKDLISGTAYTAIAKYLGVIISIGITAVLSRLLTPDDFGTVAIATIIIGFINILTISGFSTAIIQDKTLSNSDLESIFSFSFYLSLITAILFFLISPIIASFYHDKNLKIICYFLSIYIFFSLLNLLPNALLFKNKKFKLIAYRTIAVQSILGLISIIGALSGMGIYALLINPIGSSVFLFIISYRIYPIKLHYSFNLEPIRRILPFSSFQMGYNVMNYLYRNLDKLLIGRFMGLNLLGYYEKSYRLMMMPLDNISQVINPVLHPLLSEFQDNPTFIFDKYKTVSRYFAYIGFILSSYCFFCSNEIILILFGSQWEESIPVFKIFSLSIGIQLLQSAIGSIFQATGNVKQLFYAGIWAFICMIIAIIFGIVSHKLTILATYIVIAFYIIFFIYHYYLIVRVMASNMVAFIKELINPVSVSLIISSALYLYNIVENPYFMIINLINKAAVTFILIVLLQQIGFIKGIPNILNQVIKIFHHAKPN